MARAWQMLLLSASCCRINRKLQPPLGCSVPFGVAVILHFRGGDTGPTYGFPPSHLPTFPPSHLPTFLQFIPSPFIPRPSNGQRGVPEDMELISQPNIVPPPAAEPPYTIRQ